MLWADNLKIEVRTGAVTILSPVPEKYLAFTNNLNVPVEVPGLLGSFSAKRSISPRFEVGYQLDYLRVQGKANDISQTETEVRTQILTHSFQGQYNFKRNDVFKPLFNYFLYYKMGGVSVKNDRVNPDQNIPIQEGSLNSNVVIMSGMGAGVNYQLSDHLSLTGSVDINRSSDRVQEVFFPHKLFYNSSYTVNKFTELSVGLVYWFSWGTKKKGSDSNYYRPRDETQQLILKRKIERRKGKSSRSNHPLWYDPTRGK